MPNVVRSLFVISWIATACLPGLANAQSSDVSLVPAPLALSKEQMIKEDVDPDDLDLSIAKLQPEVELITAPTYSFTATTGSLEDMSSGTTQLVGPAWTTTHQP